MDRERPLPGNENLRGVGQSLVLVTRVQSTHRIFVRSSAGWIHSMTRLLETGLPKSYSGNELPYILRTFFTSLRSLWEGWAPL